MDVNGSRSSPTVTRTRFGCLGNSFVPAPQPTASGTKPGGGGPNEDTKARSSAAPVGVTCEYVHAQYQRSNMPFDIDFCTHQLARRRKVAGAGTGSLPCEVHTVPAPNGIGDAKTVSTPSRCKASTEPTVSTMLSTAPTS
eukprot:scaffold7358_cov252-Pinguiococcus_pyrenoidosus.AAC.30